MITDINQRLAEIKERHTAASSPSPKPGATSHFCSECLTSDVPFLLAEIERRDERVKVLEAAINEARPIIAYLASATAPDEDMDKHFGSKITTIHARLKIVAK